MKGIKNKDILNINDLIIYKKNSQIIFPEHFFSVKLKSIKDILVGFKIINIINMTDEFKLILA